MANSIFQRSYRKAKPSFYEANPASIVDQTPSHFRYGERISIPVSLRPAYAAPQWSGIAHLPMGYDVRGRPLQVWSSVAQAFLADWLTINMFVNCTDPGLKVEFRFLRRNVFSVDNLDSGNIPSNTRSKRGHVL